MKKEYYLTDNLKLMIDYGKYKEKTFKALSTYLDRGIYKGKEEDEEGIGAFWDLANHILSREIGWLERLIYNGEIDIISLQDLDELLDIIYDDVKEYAVKLLSQTLLGKEVD